MSRKTDRDIYDIVEEDDYEIDVSFRRNAGKAPRMRDRERTSRERERRERGRRRVDISQPFKCRHCKSFIGMPLTGGKQRNHCPNCLHSLHVDLKSPGDRLSDCRSLMEPVATFMRPNGEQVLVHRCKGCTLERHNRIAADDSPLLLMRLALVEPRAGVEEETPDRAETA